MAIRLINYVNNQKTSPALYTGSFSERPAAGIFGRLFMSIDTKEIFQDLSTSWQLLADAGAGAGTLESVTANGNSTTYGITILAGNLSLTNAVSTFSVKGLAIGGVLFPDDSSGLISQDTTNFFWDNTNNRLGIGTNTPSGKLDIHGTGINAILNGTGTNNSFLVFQNAGVSKWYAGNLFSGAVANDFVIYDAVNAAYRLYVHNTGVVNIPTSLIIGSSTPTSIYALDVAGTGRFTANITGTTATFSSSVTADAFLRASSGPQSNPTSGSSVVIDYQSTSDLQGRIRSRDWDGATWKNLTLEANNIILSPTGNVGIGTTSPVSTNLVGSQTIVKSYNSDTPTSTTAQTYYTNQSNLYLFGRNAGLSIISNSTSEEGTIFFGNASTVAYASIATGSGTSSVGGDMYFKVGSNTQRLRISATTGNIGIGATPNANYRTFIQAPTTSGSSFGLYIQAGTTSGDTAFAINNATDTASLFSIKGNGVVVINNLAGTGSRAVIAATDGTLSAPVSDLSVKQNIVPIGYGLNEILKMNPIWYDFIDEYKNNGEGRQNGNIAQEMKEIIPEAVFTTPSTGKMGIEYSQLHAVYIKAIQELNEKLVRNNIN